MKAKKTTLKNGLRILTIPMKDVATVTAMVFAETGTKYEDKKQNGISHFLEHVCFKGTVKRPKSVDITRELDSLGANTNAFTGYEYTAYYAKANSKHLSKIIDVLSDIYLNSTFPKAEVEKERGVILQEINMYEDLPKKKVHDLLQKLLYGEQPVGRTIGGKKEIVKKLKPEDFKKYRSEHYVAKGTIMVVAGNFNEKETVKIIEKSFAQIPTNKKKGKERVVEKQKKPALVLEKKKIDQTHLALAFRTFPVDDKRAVALRVLSVILGEGMSSRLFLKMREELGICYYVRSYPEEYTDHGTLTIASGVDPNRALVAVEAILEEVRKLKKEKVSEEDLKMAKEYLIGNTYLDLETSEALAGYYAVDEILRGKLEHPKDLEKEIRKVSSEDIKRLAEYIFRNERLNLAMVGKVPHRDKIQKVLKI